MRNSMNKRILILALSAFVFMGGAAQTKVIAHRGFWNTPGSAQNSLASLSKADSINCYGSEFDLWLTKDNKIVVHHDPTVKNLKIEESTLKELRQYPLNNGEKIPTLQDYLKLGKRLHTQLICEIKPHHNDARTLECVDATLKQFRKYKLTGRVTYISFSLPAVKRLIAKAPQGTEVYYLNGELSPNEIKQIGAAGIDYSEGAMDKHPEWFGECHDLGLKVNVWTVNNPAKMKNYIDRGADFITTNDPVKCKELVAGGK
jgi:glycerophosphoryl diester phosphodiesterase